MRQKSFKVLKSIKNITYHNNKAIILMLITLALIVVINNKTVNYNVNLINDKNISFISFEFNRNFTLPAKTSIDYNKNLFKNLFYNQITITIPIGAPNKKNVTFLLKLQKFAFTVLPVDSKYVKGVYDYLGSKTYRQLSNTENFMVEEYAKVILSSDLFYFPITSKGINNNKNINNDHNLTFYLVKESDTNLHITESGVIGLDIYNKYSTNFPISFIEILKSNNLISDYVFTFNYDIKNGKDKGTFIIGEYPHVYNPKIYKEKHFTYCYCDNKNSYKDIKWYLQNLEIGINYINNKDNIFSAYFYIEIGFIIANKKYLKSTNTTNYINKLVNTKQCNNVKFTINDFDTYDEYGNINDDYIGLICEKNNLLSELIHKDFPVLSIRKKNSDLYFNFTSYDLWEEIDNKLVFMVIRQDTNSDNDWIFGKPFFKKYQSIFNYDKKTFGIYKNIGEDDDSNDINDNINNKYKKAVSILIFVILIFITIITILIFILKKLFNLFPRKTRANELEDLFMYNIKNKANNELKIHDNNITI